MNASSTPGPWCHNPERSPSPTPVIGITPIKPHNDSIDELDRNTFENTDGDMTEVEDKGRTYNSNELRGSILTPRKVES